jgi:phospholipase C
MLQGDNWIGSIVSAIENGPQWDLTAIFITYDDCGCFYDHVQAAASPASASRW